MKHTQRIRFAALLAALLTAVVCLPYSGAAEEAPAVGTDVASADAVSVDAAVPTDGGEGTDYAEYEAQHPQTPSADAEAVLFEGEESHVAGDVLRYTVTIPAEGACRLTLVYRNTVKRDTVLRLTVDGELPFAEAAAMSFPTYWENEGTDRLDNRGNEFTPEQVISAEWITADCRDYAGKYEDPYSIVLPAGTHEIVLTVASGTFDLRRVALTPVPQVLPYADTADAAGEKTDAVITLEGEAAWLKSSISLIPLSNDGSPDVHPTDPVVSRLNYVGGTNWSGQNDTLVWKLSVETAGYYSLAFLYRQSELLGGVSYRHLMIDGVTPFTEAQHIKFKYSSSWEYMTFGGKDPYRVYLTAGEHTLSLAVTAGELTEIYKELETVTASMGDLYVDITMVVGETVDVSRSYELFNQIPRFNERLQEDADRLTAIADRMEQLQEKKSGSDVSIIRNAVETVQKMVDRPYSSHRYKDEFYSAYTNLSSIMGTLTQMPLDIDRIFLIGDGADFRDPRASFLNRMSFSVRRFFASFSNDYRGVAAADGEEPLSIWISWGRDQTQLLDALIQSDFVTKTGIPVYVKLVNASHIQAILSGDGPDVMLQMPHTEPVNLAMRGALRDMSQFPDFDEVTARFVQDGTLPFEYKDGTYALPDTVNFLLMFARTDVLSGMGLDIPRTWEEFIHVTTILQHSNLQVSLPNNMFPSLMTQNGLPLYNDDLTACTLTEQSAIRVMGEYATMYTKYKMPVTLSFYNRFRIGSVPLGIINYTTYVELEATAPEIAGRWTVAPIPGTVREDGTVDISCVDSGTGCAITRMAEEPEKAWKFLKWWTDAPVQLKFSNSLESVLGPLGRVSTSNVEALLSMDWSEEMLAAMKTQIAAVRQVPEIPGGYYLSRGIEQVFWNAVEQNKNVTDTMLEWGAIVNGEIARKSKEYAFR